MKEAQAFIAVVFTLASNRFPSPQLSQTVNPTSSPLIVFLFSVQQEEPANASSLEREGVLEPILTKRLVAWDSLSVFFCSNA
jgi:hypothetical protein